MIGKHITCIHIRSIHLACHGNKSIFNEFRMGSGTICKGQARSVVGAGNIDSYSNRNRVANIGSKNNYKRICNILPLAEAVYIGVVGIIFAIQSKSKATISVECQCTVITCAILYSVRNGATRVRVIGSNLSTNGRRAGVTIVGITGKATISITAHAAFNNRTAKSCGGSGGHRKTTHINGENSISRY